MYRSPIVMQQPKILLLSKQNVHKTAYTSYQLRLSIYVIIREYGSTLYVRMAPKKNGCPYISIASDDLKSLVIYYTDRF